MTAGDGIDDDDSLEPLVERSRVVRASRAFEPSGPSSASESGPALPLRRIARPVVLVMHGLFGVLDNFTL